MMPSRNDLQQERQLLVEQQKLRRAQARKFSRETNRRRKALDDRQRQWELQEQRQREDILQQRRQQMQDATERFQRAHLPPSQRRRPPLQRNATNLEDALEKIQSTSGPCSWQNPSFTSNTNISRPPRQPSLSTVCGVPKPGPGCSRRTPAAAAGSHFTREAWADVGVQERSAEVKMPRGNAGPGGPRVPRREHSAREGAGPVSSGTRKGTVLRPQSATEVSGIAKTQGRMMTTSRPPPPPRVEAAAEKTPCGPDLTRINCKPSPAAEQTLHRRNSDVSLPPHTRCANAAQDCGAMYARLPPFPEGGPKSSPGSGHPDSRKRCSQTGLRSYTPTDEEISRLWNDIRSVLADGKAGLRKQAPERKPCAQPCPQPLLQTAQPTKQNAQLTRGLANNLHTGFESAAQFHLAEVQAGGLLKQRNTVAARETARTQLGLTNISMEEQKILLSLERLDHRLHCVQQYAGGNSTSHGPVLIDPSYTGEMKVNLSKRSASSANSRHRYAKKF